ncbi:YgjV family protein [Paucibacter sp. TC2R-5]|uniref:YgjV family protein n=1 Tax=Paucibacter sp. TC2R-5 TaxID=2893555 RepID=UPI0021E398C2|nr:YgjV family protein [Paucibacter sp. TC2R-5]MCV2359775.1 YgjV family protein [Paucibacter sp. TC2R-5]
MPQLPISNPFEPAQLFGYAAFALGVACFAQTDDRRFKIFMALECLSYALHFSLLGQPTAVASSLVSLGRSVAAIRSHSPWVAVFFIALSLALGAWLQTGWLSLLPIAASCIGTTALFFLKGMQMRLLMLVGTLLWLANNLWVGSIGGSLLEATIAATNIMTLLRLQRRTT